MAGTVRRARAARTLPGPTSKNVSTSSPASVSMEERHRTGETRWAANRSGQPSPSAYGRASAFETIGATGVEKGVAASTGGSAAAAGAMRGGGEGGPAVGGGTPRGRG